MATSDIVYDVAIVGGGPAGKQAALTLARLCRSVVLFDGGVARNRVAKVMHNWIGAEGMQLAAFAELTDRDLARFGTIARVNEEVIQTVGHYNDFMLKDTKENLYRSRRILFAGGVDTVLPKIEGIDSAWGSTVFSCTYCHGYEQKNQKIGLLTTPEHALAWIEIFYAITPHLTLFFNGTTPSAEALSTMQRLKVASFVEKIARLESVSDQEIDIVLESGARERRKAFFVPANVSQRSPVPFSLNCAVTESGKLKADAWGNTSVPGVFAAGDITDAMSQQLSAASSGMMAGVMIATTLNRDDMKSGFRAP